MALLNRLPLFGRCPECRHRARHEPGWQRGACAIDAVKKRRCRAHLGTARRIVRQRGDYNVPLRLRQAAVEKGGEASGVVGNACMIARVAAEPLGKADGNACACEACRQFSRAYLRHLFVARELLAYRLLSIHNITFYLTLMVRLRAAIAEGTFAAFRARFLARYGVESVGDSTDSPRCSEA